jgi:hypothetical protein
MTTEDPDALTVDAPTLESSPPRWKLLAAVVGALALFAAGWFLILAWAKARAKTEIQHDDAHGDARMATFLLTAELEGGNLARFIDV